MKRLVVLSAALLIAVISFAQQPHGHGHGKYPKGKKARAAYQAGFRDGFMQAQHQHGPMPYAYHHGQHKQQKHGHCHGQCRGNR